jgi:Na+:H+ antiporter, NhaA family
MAPKHVREILRNETVGGALLLAAAVFAVAWANSPWKLSYENLINLEVGPQAFHLHLSLESWAADGLLAVFFFIAGLELKYEFVLGSLRHASTALVPVAAAIGGMLIPAAVYLGFNLSMADGQPQGWGIPMATDIAFALAVLAVTGRFLPTDVRVFLLTLAVVDDLGAISVIALFYTEHLALLPSLGAGACLVAYYFAQRLRFRSPLLYVPLALMTWVLVHSSGIHATVAGVALGLLTRVKPDLGEREAPAERMQHLIQPISAGVCVPVFALFAAGVDISEADPSQILTQPVALGIVVGLVVGKPIGIIGSTWLITKLSSARLAATIHWRDVFAIGLVAGVGFTVSLLISQLAFTDSPELLAEAKLAVLLGSVVAALLASLALLRRNRHHKSLAK